VEPIAGWHCDRNSFHWESVGVGTRRHTLSLSRGSFAHGRDIRVAQKLMMHTSRPIVVNNSDCVLRLPERFNCGLAGS
jgi:hypothetical protein